MNIEEKQEILKAIFSVTDISNQRVKDKIEGIIIGATLRDHTEEVISNVNKAC